MTQRVPSIFKFRANALPLFYDLPEPRATISLKVAQPSFHGDSILSVAVHDSIQPTTVTTTSNVTSNAGSQSSQSSVPFSVRRQQLSSKAEMLQTMSTFLGPRNITSSSPVRISLATLDSSYRSLKFTPGFRRFITAHSDTLLDILGTLLTESRNPFGRSLDVRQARILVKVEGDEKDSLAKLIFLVAADQKRLGVQVRGPWSTYWLFRACLTELRTHLTPEKSLLENARSQKAIMRLVQYQYCYLRKLASSPALHGPYFLTLIDISCSNTFAPGIKARCWDTLVDQLSLLLMSHTHVHASILDLLWEVVLKPARGLSEEQMQKLVQGLAVRIHKLEVEGSSTSAGGIPRVDSVVDVQGLASVVSKTLFSTRSTPTHLRSWVEKICGGSLIATNPDQVFKNFTLLSLFNASASLFRSHSLPLFTPSPSSSAAEIEFRVLFILANMERDLSIAIASRTAPPDLGAARRVLDATWHSWSASLQEGQDAKPQVVMTAMLSSFFRLIGRARHPELLPHVFDECIRLGLLSDDCLFTSPGSQALFAAYAAASFSCSSFADWHRTFQEIKEPLFSLPSETQTALLGRVILQLTRLPATVPAAHWLYCFLGTSGSPVSLEVAQTVALSLARSGYLDHAITYIHPDAHLQLTQPFRVLTAILKVIAQNESQSNSKFVLGTPLASQLSMTISSLLNGRLFPLHSRRYLEGSLSAIARASNSANVVPIAKTLMRGLPDPDFFFSSSFWTALFQALLAQRRLRAAHDLNTFLEQYLHLYPRPTVLKWQHMLYRRCIRDQSTQLARETYRQEGQGHLLLHNAPKADNPSRLTWRKQRDGLYTLRLPKMLFKMKRLELGACAAVMREFIKTGRIRAAKRLHMQVFERMQAQEIADRASYLTSPPTSLSAVHVHTVLGNMILDHASLSRTSRSRQMVRKIQSTLDELVRENGFVPDRVSVNVLLKSFLRWKGSVVDAGVIRRLTDRLVRSGYPTCGVVKDGEVPFETLLPVAAGHLPSFPTCLRVNTLPSDLDALMAAQAGKPISWRRHTRPLYTMIAKALRIRGDERGAKKMVDMLRAGNEKFKSGVERRGRAEVRAARAAKDSEWKDLQSMKDT